MARSDITRELVGRTKAPKSSHFITRGIVVDTADPHEMGRVKIFCEAYNDSPDNLEDLPWADYMSPFAGSALNLERGPEGELSSGRLSYGFWSVPTVGALAIVCCLDNDSAKRVWLGCIPNMFATNTMPHGRFLASKTRVIGPATDTVEPISKLYTNLHDAFGDTYEFITRGADYSVGSLSPDIKALIENNVVDSKNKTITLPDGTTIEYTQGYSDNKRNQDSNSKKEPQTYSWTTPGFHAISMDDRAENCRIRIRTTTGHQFLMDDTNERILVSTAGGKSFIEMDQIGNIDVFAERNLAFHSGKDMSFTSDGAMRFRAHAGLHILSDADIRLQSVTSTNLRASNIIASATNVSINANQTVNVNGGSQLNLTGTTTNLFGSGVLNMQGASSVNISSALILQTAAAIHLNGPVAAPATPASTTESLYPYSSNRVPFRINGNGQAWSRSMLATSKTDKDSANNSIDYYDYANMEHQYNSASVGKVEQGEEITRNKKWRR